MMTTRWLTRVGFVLALALLTCRPNLAALAPGPAAGPTPSMLTAYRLGLALYLPVAQSEYFDHEVQSLADVTSDTQKKTKMLQLDQLATKTRQIEQQSLAQVTQIMQQIGAPRTVRAPYEHAAAVLSRPLVTANDAKPYVKSDPSTARILSTLEEADGLIPADMSPLATWLSVARGADTDWAFHMGTLTASLAVASDYNEPAVALLSTVPSLAAKAPADAPAGAKDAMVALMKDVQARDDVTQPMLSAAALALHKSFQPD